MPRASQLLASFNSGELSPNVEGRADVEKYGAGCKSLENYLPMIQGPAHRRGGTRFVAEVKDSTKQTWLVRFEFNTKQAYQLEFGDRYIRFYTNRGQLQIAPPAAWVTATAYVIGDLRAQGGVNYYCTTAHTSGTFATDLANGNWYALTGTIYEIPSPWLASDLTNADGSFGLRFVESNDIVYLCHQNYAPRKLLRYGTTNWQIQAIAPLNGPFKPGNSTTTTVYASATTGDVTLTASANLFSAAMVGMQFQLGQTSVLAIKQWEAAKSVTVGDLRRANGVNYKALTTGTTGSNRPSHTSGAVYDGDSGVQWQYQDPGYGYGFILSYTSPTQVTLRVINQLPAYAVGSGNASTNWAMGAWSDVDGWPSQVSFYKERLTFGRGQNVWMSVSGDYENFAARDQLGIVGDDRAISLTLQSDKVNNLQWFASSDALLCGTAGGEFAIQSITNNLPFGPTNCTAPMVSAFGGRNATPVRIGEAVLFVQRSGIKMRDIVYDFVSNKFVSNDQNTFADHITQGGLTQIVYQQEPYSIVWAVRADGLLVAMTYSREQYQSSPYGGWHRHPLGGSFQGGPAVVECLSTCPSPAADRDDLWLIVKRTINGSTKRYIEFMDYERRFNDDPQDAFHVDCGLTLDNTIAQTLTPGAGATVAGQTDVVFTTGGAVFSAGSVNRQIHVRTWTLASDGKTRIYNTAKALITSYVSATQVKCSIMVPFASTATIAAGAWRLTVLTISGLNHLEGQTVQILGDGARIPDAVVTGGSITMQNTAGKVQVGLGSRARLQTMRINAGSGDGTTQGKTSRINKVAVRFKDTLGCKFGPSFDALEELNFREVVHSMDAPPELFSGDKVVEFDGDYSTNPWVCVQQDEPFPSTIVAIVPVNSAYDYS